MVQSETRFYEGDIVRVIARAEKYASWVGPMFSLVGSTGIITEVSPFCTSIALPRVLFQNEEWWVYDPECLELETDATRIKEITDFIRPIRGHLLGE